jgi:aspartyl-tRNA(Asn)/glutamyl-tRNA(Gln) amidotransferase subunit A
MPVSLKDLIDVAGLPTTAASKVREGHVAQRDAVVVTRLREAGAVLLGKTNLHEFALGPTSDESAFGPVRNPYDESRVAGGSSGGSAAAVATGMSVASIGSDTGGSIRIPAAACGVVGLKPSLGEVPTDGVVPLSRTLDHVGPLARNVREAAAVWAVLAGRDIPTLAYRDGASLSLATLGGYFTSLLADDVRAAFDGAVARLRRSGARMNGATLPHTDAIVSTYANISLPEAAAWHAATLATHGDRYQPVVHSRLQQGATIAAVDYIRALETRVAMRDAVDAALQGQDALLLPTLPITAPHIGASEVTFSNGTTLPARGALLRLTQVFNISGHPAISLPLAAAGLPVGLQLVGHRDRTEDLLGTALAVESLLADS